jgi:hypothetical protein
MTKRARSRILTLDELRLGGTKRLPRKRGPYSPGIEFVAGLHTAAARYHAIEAEKQRLMSYRPRLTLHELRIRALERWEDLQRQFEATPRWVRSEALKRDRDKAKRRKLGVWACVEGLDDGLKLHELKAARHGSQVLQHLAEGSLLSTATQSAYYTDFLAELRAAGMPMMELWPRPQRRRSERVREQTREQQGRYRKRLGKVGLRAKRSAAIVVPGAGPRMKAPQWTAHEADPEDA